MTPDELAQAVVYITITPIPTGTKLSFPRISIEVPWDAAVAFVDRDPMANWSHSCRYLLINVETSEIRSYEAGFPPFQPDQMDRWRVIYQAPSIPDAGLVIPRS